MRIFQHWARVRGVVEWKGNSLPIAAYGGSNRSLEEAERDGEARLRFIENRIRGVKDWDEGYEVDILEEPLERLDEFNVITRNRYGAEILNSQDHFFVDLDFSPAGCLGMLAAIFGWRRNREQQVADKIAFLEKRASDPRLQGRSIRIYETHNGLRALISGGDCAPTANETQKLMRDLRSDWLYTILCRKQGCFRARLTPKPYRMKARTMRVKYPRSAEEDAEVAGWVREYNERSQKFATCRYVKTIGPEFSDAVVRLHDERTGAHSDRRLA